MKITKVDGVCGGRACIKWTRIPVWHIEQNRRIGLSMEEMLDQYRTLDSYDIQAAYDYADINREEIDRDIAEQEEFD